MKLLKRLLLAITLIVTATGTASAQKGMSGIGVNVGLDLDQDYLLYEFALLSNVSIKYQYNFSNYYRIEPIVSCRYVLSTNTDYNSTNFEISINNHFFMTKVNRLRPYAIVGIGYMHETDTYYGEIYPNAIFRGGIGIDYRFSHNWSGQASLCYLGTFDNCGFIDFEIGIAYNF